MNKFERTGNLLVLERQVASELPLRSNLLTIFGDKNYDAIDNLLKNCNKQDLAHLTESVVESFGFSKATAKKVIALIDFTRSLQKLPDPQALTIRSPQDAATHLMYLQNETQEHFVCLFLNTKNQVIARKTIFIGSLNSAIVHPREIFKEAVKVSAASVILSHVHPSGNPAPSPEDIEVTRRCVEAGLIMGCEVVDHIIIGAGNYISLKQKGYI